MTSTKEPRKFDSKSWIAKMTGSSQAIRSHWASVFALILIGGAFPIFFYIGQGSAETLEINRTAIHFLDAAKIGAAQFLDGGGSKVIVQAFRDVIADSERHKILATIAQSLSFAVFGKTEGAASYLAYFVSLANILLIYEFARHRISNGAAFFMASIWALASPNLLFATQHIQLSLSFSLFLIGLNIGKKGDQKLSIWRISFLFLITAALALDHFWLALALAIYLFDKRFNSVTQRPFLLAVPILLLLAFQGFANEGLVLNAAEIIRMPGFAAILVMGIGALASAYWQKNNAPLENDNLTLILASIALFPLLIGEISLPEIWMAFMLAVFILSIYAGSYFMNMLSQAVFTRLRVLAPLIVIGVAGLLGYAYARLIPFVGSSRHSLIYAIMIIEGIFFILVVASPYLLSRAKSQNKNALGFVLFVSLILVLLGAAAEASWEPVRENSAGREAYRAIYSGGEEPSLAILNDRRLRSQLEFQALEAKHDLGDIDVVGRNELAGLEADLFLAWNEELNAYPEGFIFLKSFASVGKGQLNLFAMEGSLGVGKNGTPCGFLTSILDKPLSKNTEILALPIPLSNLSSCISTNTYSDKIEELISSRTGLYLDPIIKQSSDGDYLEFFRKYSYYFDPRLFDFYAEIEADSLYLYSVTVKAKEAISTLYWGTENNEGAFGGGRFGGWTEFSLLIRTGSELPSQTILLSPVIFDHYGVVMIRDFYFEAIEIIE